MQADRVACLDLELAIDVSVAPLPTDASVWKNTTSTPIDAETLAPPLSEDAPPAAAIPQRHEVVFVAVRVQGLDDDAVAVDVACVPIDAVFVMSATLTPTAAATWVPSTL